MSTSRRSSTVSRKYSAPNVWRSVSTSKNSARTSLSLVFAEPEKGTPLSSAAAKLPAGKSTALTTMKRSSSSKSNLPEEQKIGDGASTSGTFPEPQVVASPSASSESLPTIPPSDGGNSIDEPANAQIPRVDTTTDERSPNSAPANAAAPSAVNATYPLHSNSNTNTQPFPRKSSWLGPGSRTKEKSKEVAKALENGHVRSNALLAEAENPPNKINAAFIPSSPLVMVQPPSPEPKSKETDRSEPVPQPRLLPPAQPPKWSWFSSSPAPSSSPRPGESSIEPMAVPTPVISSHISTVSPVDDQVPLILPVTPPTSHGVVENQSGDGSTPSSLPAPNPSTSRFTLSIPLLGRPKMPLDKAVSVARAEAPEHLDQGASTAGSKPMQVSANIPEATFNGVIDTPNPEEHTTTVATASSPSISVTPSNGPQGPPSAEPESHMPQSSWWDYVGWGTSSAVPANPAPQDLSGEPTRTPFPGKDVPVANADPLNPDSALMTSDDKNPQTPINNVPESTPLDPSTANGKALPEATTHKALSIRSAETSQSQGSAWYSPWTWYGASSSIPVKVDELPGSNSEAKTESEMVKEEALTRLEEPTAPPSTPAPITMPPSQEYGNPIESTYSVNMLGWSSFFSSKALAVKRITAEEAQRDENGMEVMDLDEDEPKAETSPPSVPVIPVPTIITTSSKPKETTERPSQPSRKQDKLPPSPNKTDSNPELSNAPSAPPLTNSDSIKREVALARSKSGSPVPLKKSGANTPPPRPNLVLPTWADTFHSPPRSLVPPSPTSGLTKTLQFVSGVLFAKDEDGKGKGKGKERDRRFSHFGKELPRAWDLGGAGRHPDVLRGCSRVVVIGIHGWFPGTVMRTVIGEPTGTSTKFVNMMVQALEDFQHTHNVTLKKITKIPLEGEGTINSRVNRLYKSMLENQEWMDDLHAADVIFVATHSQGCIVSTHLLDLLIHDKHIRTPRNAEALGTTASFSAPGMNVAPAVQPQKICCLALCGIHLGPLRYLNTSTVLQPYFQYFESAAARELFQFQNTESQVSKAYVKALKNIVDNGTKMVYVASLNDQAVPLYSALFASVCHPLILRALYIDGDAYHSSDFLANLLVLLLRVLNSGIPDSGLLGHLSEATAGSLNGLGHSTAYEELSTYSLAVKYLFLTDDGHDEHPELKLEPFDAASEQNDYEIPWALRDLIADERVAHLFSGEISELRDAFREWHPKTTILRDIKRKLQPIQRLPSISTSSSISASKL